MCVFMYLGHLGELKLFGIKRCISTTFGHTSEKRTRSQPWLLNIKDCTNQPSEDDTIESLEESKRGRKMKKLHFRRFFRPTTTTRGGSTAGPPPELHHRWGRLPWPAAHMVMKEHMPTHPPISPLTTLHHSTTFLFIFTHHPLTYFIWMH